MMLTIGTIDNRDGTPFALPLDAATQKFAFLARSGAGKTYAATRLAETMHAAGIPFVALDPVGVWYGLRLAADGVGPGLPIPVFGGEYGDIPLEPSAGALVADLVVDRALSLILDVSGFRKGQRKEFVTSFAEELFHRKKTARSPLHLFLEEAQAFVPQRIFKGEERMLGAFEDIGKIGRNYGIGLSLISQRPQAVNKDVLNMAEVLVVLQTNAAQERKAIRAWIDTQGIDATSAVEELPNLAIGEAYIWSPQWLRFFGKVRIGEKLTYNAWATPTFATAAAVPRPLEEADLAALREAMQPAIPEASTHHPATLRRRIAELEQQLREHPPAEQPSMSALDAERIAQLEQTVAQLAGAVTEISVVPALDAKRLTRLEQSVAQLAGAVTEISAAPALDAKRLTRLEQSVAQLASTLAEISVALRAMPAATPAPAAYVPPSVAPAKPQATPQPAAATTRTPNAPASAARAPAEAPQLRAGERRVLAILARHSAFRVTRAQLGTLGGFASTGGTFVSYLGTLKRAGLITEANGILQITKAGMALFGDRVPAPPQTTEELLAQWSAALRAGERRMLHLLVAAYPAWRSRSWLASQTGYALTGGTFGAYLGTLRRNGLIELRGDQLRASPTLFVGTTA